MGRDLPTAHLREPGNRLKDCDGVFPPWSLFTSKLPVWAERKSRAWPTNGFQSWSWWSEGSWGMIGVGPNCGCRAERSKTQEGWPVRSESKAVRKTELGIALEQQFALERSLLAGDCALPQQKHVRSDGGSYQKPSSHSCLETGPTFWYAQIQENQEAVSSHPCKQQTKLITYFGKVPFLFLNDVFHLVLVLERLFTK